MGERIIQHGFDLDSNQIVEHDVTPPGYTGIQYPDRTPDIITPSQSDLVLTTSDVAPELGRFVREAAVDTRFESPEDAISHLYDHVFTPWNAFEQEELWMLLLNIKNTVTHEAMLYRGTINSIYIRTPEVFREAVRLNAASLILAHNHPSSDPEPSREDVRATEKIVEVGRLIEIEVLDHLILGADSWVSLKDRDIGF